eukprot:2677167-Heterocapsa_arctica.AAC.1
MHGVVLITVHELAQGQAAVAAERHLGLVDGLLGDDILRELAVQLLRRHRGDLGLAGGRAPR